MEWTASRELTLPEPDLGDSRSGSLGDEVTALELLINGEVFSEGELESEVLTDRTRLVEGGPDGRINPRSSGKGHSEIPHRRQYPGEDKPFTTQGKNPSASRMGGTRYYRPTL